MPILNHPNIIRLSSIIMLSSAIVACGNDNNTSSTPLVLETLQQKASYGYGVDIANQLTQQGIELDVNALNQGLADAFNNVELALNEEQRLQAQTEFQNILRDAAIKKQTDIAVKNLAEGEAFLTANAKEDGVITTESGLQYKILVSGDGEQPKASDTVTTHYVGTLIDGREFDSSIARGTPASFPVEGVIKGWTEALQLMHVGDKWRLFIPAELAYGATQRSALIQPNSTLIFELELLGIKE